jgi:hypothetical protein
VKLQISDAHGDDFINKRVRVRASDGATAVVWTLPNRLLAHPGVVEIVASEIGAELTERSAITR